LNRIEGFAFIVRFKATQRSAIRANVFKWRAAHGTGPSRSRGANYSSIQLSGVGVGAWPEVVPFYAFHPDVRLDEQAPAPRTGGGGRGVPRKASMIDERSLPSCAAISSAPFPCARIRSASGMRSAFA
jgi:hypothetical protein